MLIERRKLLQASVAIIITLMLCQRAYGSIIMQHIDTKFISVYCMFKDRDGMMWAGTSRGLMSYPQLLSTAPTDYKRPHDLSNIITQIRQDNLGRLWLRTQANHALVYDPHSNKLISDVEHYLQGLGMKLWYEFLLETDDRGRIWFYKDNVITVKDFKSGQCWRNALPTKDGRIVDMCFHGGQMYTVTEHAIYTCSLQGRHISAYRMTSTDETVCYDRTYMFVDKDNNIWLKRNGELARCDAHTHAWKAFPQVLSDITGITQDYRGNIVVASSNHGVFVFSSNGNSVEQVTQTLPLVDGLSNNHIQCVYYDTATKSVVVAYHKNGLSLVNPQSPSSQLIHIQDAKRHYSVDDVICMTDAGNGDYWIGTEDNGIYLLDRHGTVKRNLFSLQTATAVLKDHAGRVWAGLFQHGLFCEDGRSFFPGKSPYNILELSPGRLFVNLNGEGLFVLDTNSGKATQIPTDNKWIMDIGIYGDKIFAATPLFLYIIDKNTLSIQKVSAANISADFSNSIKTLLVDHRGWVWLVNYMLNSPVDIYDYPHKRVIQVPELSKYSILAMTEDKQGNIWCSTDNGLIRISTDGKDYPHFNIINFGDPIKVMSNERATTTLSDGQLLFGTTSGVFRINPTSFLNDFLHGKQDEEALTLSVLKINNRTISPGDKVDGKVVAPGDLCYLKKLDLSYEENNIVMQFRPGTITPEEEQVWNYKLDGMDNDFSPINANNTVIISNLPPGVYHLLMRYKSSGKVYDMLTIHIRPPFYRTIWAYLVYLLLLLFIGWLFYNRQQIRIHILSMRVKAEQEKKLNELKINFFTNMSHELRTPLTLVASPLEELLKKPMDKEMHGTLSLVYRNTQRLITIVKQILDIRIDGTTDEEYHPQSADLSDFVGKICGLYKMQAKMHHIDFSFECNKEQEFIFFDMHKMEVIVNNLLSNAFKYTPDGGSIHVNVNYQEQGTLIQVADTGVGIKDKDKERIFDRYYRTSTHLDDRKSSGIGLDVVRKYVMQHNGSITVTDNKPRGSVFHVWLPVEATTGDTTMPMTEMEASQNTKGKKLPTLLIVEDNVEMLAYLSSQLGTDYRILRATDGNAALEVLHKEDNVDIVISDVMMEGMDGLTLTKTIKNDVSLSHIPVILLTAKALDEDELRGLQMGANDYVTKPFNLDVLRVRIRRQLERREGIWQSVAKGEELKPADVAVTTLDEEFMKKVMNSIEKNMSNADYSVDDLSHDVDLHRTNVYKKIQFITGKTPLMFIRLMRLKRAHQLMSQGGVMVSQVAYQVGFNNPKIFSRYFKEQYGMYPSEYIKKQGENNS